MRRGSLECGRHGLRLLRIWYVDDRLRRLVKCLVLCICDYPDYLVGSGMHSSHVARRLEVPTDCWSSGEKKARGRRAEDANSSRTGSVCRREVTSLEYRDSKRLEESGPYRIDQAMFKVVFVDRTRRIMRNEMAHLGATSHWFSQYEAGGLNAGTGGKVLEHARI